MISADLQLHFMLGVQLPQV